MPIWTSIRAYAAHDDPLVAAANLIALVVASNQPFYPLYLYWFVGPDIGASFLTFLSTPFFLAVPALARRNTLAGRALLPLAGLFNTTLCAKLFGEASGVELFLAPTLMLAALLFRQSERLVMLGLVGLVLASFKLLHGRYGTSFHPYTAEQYARFLRLNAFSAGTLTAFVGISFSSVLARAEGKG